MKKDEALKMAFPKAERIEEIQIFLDKSEVDRIESKARVKLDSRLFIFYKGLKDNNISGYAIIDTHKLRTKTETVIYVLEPDGKLKNTEILAFFEPSDYEPGSKWLDLYKNRRLDESLRLGRDIPNITGATITSNEFTKSVRKILAIYEVAVSGKGRE